MVDAAQVKFREVEWSLIAARELSNIADAEPCDIRVFAEMVTAGHWFLWDIEVNGARIGCVVWSVEGQGADTEIIINAAAAAPVKGVDITRVMFSTFLQMAKEAGARAVRCWTSREGLRRKLENMGAKRRYVMEIKT